MKLLDYLKAQWPEVTFATHETRPWASSMFKGTRHAITLTMPNTSDFLSELPDHFFHAYATYTNTDVVGGYTLATVEIVTLED